MSKNAEFRYWRTRDPQLRSRVKELRHDPTPCEQTFWQAVKAKSVEGVKFRRQHPFEGFILDFYAPELNLVVEIDGAVHDDPQQKQYDRWRDAKMRGLGLHVVRFSNDEIAVDFEGVVSRLRQVIGELRSR